MTITPIWILKKNDDILGTFKTKEAGFDAALNLLSEKFTSIPQVIDTVLRHRHTKSCRALIEKLKNIKNLISDDFCEQFYECTDSLDESISENLFEAYYVDGFLVIEFGAAPDDFYIETNFWADEENVREYDILVKSNAKRVEYHLIKYATLPTTANIFLVYQALTTTPQLRSEIHERVKYNSLGYNIDLSNDTISNQIKALQSLGIPVYDIRLNPKQRKNDYLFVGNHTCEHQEGFYIDESRPIPTPDYSKCKPGTYIMMVYLTLKEIDKAHVLSTQQQIIDAVYNKFGIKLQRQKVKNYLDLLIELGSGIKHDKSGYWMK